MYIDPAGNLGPEAEFVDKQEQINQQIGFIQVQQDSILNKFFRSFFYFQLQFHHYWYAGISTFFILISYLYEKSWEICSWSLHINTGLSTMLFIEFAIFGYYLVTTFLFICLGWFWQECNSRKIRLLQFILPSLLILALVSIIFFPLIELIQRQDLTDLCQYTLNQLTEIDDFKLDQDKYILTQLHGDIQKKIDRLLDEKPEMYTNPLLIKGYPGVGKSTAVRKILKPKINSNNLILYFDCSTISVRDFRDHSIRQHLLLKNIPKSIIKLSVLNALGLYFQRGQNLKYEKQFLQIFNHLTRVSKTRLILVLDGLKSDFYQGKLHQFLENASKQMIANNLLKIIFVQEQPIYEAAMGLYFDIVTANKNCQTQIREYIQLRCTRINQLISQESIFLISQYSNSFKQALNIGFHEGQTIDEIQIHINKMINQSSSAISYVFSDNKQYLPIFCQKHFSQLTSSIRKKLVSIRVLFELQIYYSRIGELSAEIVCAIYKNQSKKKENQEMSESDKFKIISEVGHKNKI